MNEDLIEHFEQVDHEFEQNSSEGPIEAANSANGDHIKLWASDQEDRFLSEEDEQMGDINEESEDGEYSSEGEPDSEMNNSNFSSDEEGQIWRKVWLNCITQDKVTWFYSTQVARTTSLRRIWTT